MAPLVVPKSARSALNTTPRGHPRDSDHSWRPLFPSRARVCAPRDRRDLGATQTTRTSSANQHTLRGARGRGQARACAANSGAAPTMRSILNVRAFAVFERKVFWGGVAAAKRPLRGRVAAATRAPQGPIQPPTPGRCGVGARKRGSNAQARLRVPGSRGSSSVRAPAPALLLPLPGRRARTPPPSPSSSSSSSSSPVSAAAASP